MMLSAKTDGIPAQGTVNYDKLIPFNHFILFLP